MGGIIKKFKDYFKSEPEVKPKDPRELDLDYVKQQFQVLTDSATDIESVKTTYALYDDKKPKVGQISRSMRGYPCLNVRYYFKGDEMEYFERCAKWADKAADIFESETEFNVFVSSEEIREWMTGEWMDDDGIRVYQNPNKEITGYYIDISIINRRIPVMSDAMYKETFFYDKDEHSISLADNNKILKFIEGNLMWDFKDNDIEYGMYGEYDFNYDRYKGIVISIYKSDNVGSDIKFDHYEDKNPNKNIVIDPFLYPILRRLYQKINDIAPCKYEINADTSSVTVQFSYLTNEINL